MSGQFESVLVLTFNITLWHYLLNLAKQHKNPNARIHSSIEWNHFHQWCIDRCFEAGLGSEYRGLWKHHPDRVLEHDLPELTRKALQITGRKYDAILIDEGQDFHIAWWNVVRSTLRARGGKVFLVADRTQDLYEKAGTWVEAENEDRLNLNWTETDDRKGTGFRTDWHDLTKSYRLPFPVIHRLRAFAENYLADAPLLPEAPGQGELWPCSLRWIQVTDERTLERAVADSAEELLDKLSSLGAPLGDLVVMTCTKETGRRCVSEMRIRRPSVKIQDTFVDARQACSGIPGKDWQCQNRIHQLERLKKIAFIETGDSLRITTIKSFKGWEARAVIAVIESGQSVADLREAYVALTRVKRDEHGSFITVICAEPSLRGLGSTWNVDYPGQL